MKYHQIGDPNIISQTEIDKLISDGARVVVQFSKPGYTIELLAELNALSRASGRNLGIRFYGHYGLEFDASILQYLPDVSVLSVDCLTKAKNLGVLSTLGSLRELSLGVYEMDAPDILSELSLQNIESLTLAATRKANIRLGYLKNFKNLVSFHTTGHANNLDSLTEAPNLRKLSLSQIKKKVSLSFISRLKSLTDLRILLGGRESLEEIENENIRTLEVIRVMGLSELGNIGRFKYLEDLSVEDQIRLNRIVFTGNDLLRRIKIINCKKLEQIEGLSSLKALEHLRIYQTAIDYEQFISGSLPGCLKVLAFYTTRSKRDEEIKKDLRLRGYAEVD